jgi:putative transposase
MRAGFPEHRQTQASMSCDHRARCTVHKHRNLLAHAPEWLHDEITADYTDMINAATPEEIEERRKSFIRKW